MSEKNRMSPKMIILCIIIVVFLMAIAIPAMLESRKNSEIYNSGIIALQNQEWSNAKDLFYSVLDYKDSKNLYEYAYIVSWYYADLARDELIKSSLKNNIDKIDHLKISNLQIQDNIETVKNEMSLMFNNFDKYEADRGLRKEQESEEKVIELFEAIALSFNINNDYQKISYKEIENIYKEYPTNYTISNLYAFCVSNECLWFDSFMDGEQYLKDAKEEAAKIDPNYNGQYADIIIPYAEKLLGDSYVELREKSMQRQNVFDNLSQSDKIEIYAYIANRYDYYDKQEGKPTGDKHSAAIWEETAEKYNLSTSHIDKIWLDTSISSQYHKNNSAPTSSSSSTSTYSSSSSKVVTSYDATLEYGNDTVLICISEEAMDRFFTALANKNEGTLTEMQNSGEIGFTPKGTKCNIVKSKITKYQVKLLDGPYEGNTVWVIMESVKKK